MGRAEGCGALAQSHGASGRTAAGILYCRRGFWTFDLNRAIAASLRPRAIDAPWVASINWHRRRISIAGKADGQLDAHLSVLSSGTAAGGLGGSELVQLYPSRLDLHQQPDGGAPRW